MSDTTVTPTPADVAAKVAESGQQVAPAAEQPRSETETVEFWKQKAREQEKRAKDNAEAAKRLAEIEEASKTAEQKAAEREAQAIKRAEQAEARATRREVALDPAGDGSLPALSGEDATLLDSLTNEDAMRALAKRLSAAAQAQASPRAPRPNPAQREGTSPAEDKDAIARAFFGL